MTDYDGSAPWGVWICTAIICAPLLLLVALVL